MLSCHSELLTCPRSPRSESQPSPNHHWVIQYWLWPLGKTICDIHQQIKCRLQQPRYTGGQNSPKYTRQDHMLQLPPSPLTDTDSTSLLQIPPNKTHMDPTWPHQVDWQVLHLSLELFSPGNQRRILLFINDKLPLQTSKAHPHRGLTLCPLCQCDNEDAGHFLMCPHMDHTNLFNDLNCNLTMTTKHFQLHPCLHTAIWLGIASIRQNTPYPDVSGSNYQSNGKVNLDGHNSTRVR